VFEDNDSLYFYDPTSNPKLIKEIYSKPNDVQEFYFDITSNNTIILQQNRENIETLSRITPSTDISVTIIDAETISFGVIEGKVYFNSTDSLEQEGLQAHWLSVDFERNTFENSIWVFAENHRTPALNPELFLVSSDDESSLGFLTTPQLYAFDESNTKTGRKQVTNKDKKTVDFSFGQITQDISGVAFGEVTNDIFGRINLRSTRNINNTDTKVIESYYFNPSETDPYKEGEANKALQHLYFFEAETI